MGGRAFAVQPARHLNSVLLQCPCRRRHVNAEGFVDWLMADAESEDHAALGGVGNKGSAPRTQIGMAQINVCHPAADLDAGCGFSHQLSGCQHIGIDLCGEDCFEAGRFSFAGDSSDVRSTPTSPRDDAESHPFCHISPLARIFTSCVRCDPGESSASVLLHDYRPLRGAGK
jgi:hypothetical protein